MNVTKVLVKQGKLIIALLLLPLCLVALMCLWFWNQITWQDTCQECGEKLIPVGYPDELFGQEYKCPKCKKTSILPSFDIELMRIEPKIH